MKDYKKVYFLLLLVAVSIAACSGDSTTFERLDARQTGIDFVNQIEEGDSLNVLINEYTYNGAGVGTADFTGNGYPDIFFAGNTVRNRLYTNHGDFTFTDVTAEANLSGNDAKWYSGVTIVDINHDGLPDIYLSVTASDDPELRRNELYVNSGLNENGVPVFEEMAEAYGLDDPSYSTHAVFFDADNNGYLDMYLLVAYSASDVSYANMMAQRGMEEQENTDKLFAYSWDEEKGHPVYSDISEQAGINRAGHGLGVQVVDINQNGFKDIYVANDYISEDIFWINNGDGTFTNQARDMFKHTSYSAMGTDIADINNSGRMDIFTLDMLPEINVRRKMMANPNNYRNYLNDVFSDVHPQYTRNTLQLNAGPADTTALPVFSEIALYANVAATDWSWAPLLLDYDNNGHRDLFVTNGIPRDITDKDFWNEYGRVQNVMPMNMALPKIPGAKVPNYMFSNGGDLQFDDVTVKWGFQELSYSTGVVYADLNNNGAMDLIINNTNDPASIYRNRSLENSKAGNQNWLKLKFEGDSGNPDGHGAVVDLYYDGSTQTYEHTPYKGYLSSVDPTAHIGLGGISDVDSIIVNWPSGEGDLKQVIRNEESNNILTLRKSDAAKITEDDNTAPEAGRALFRDVTEKMNVSYRHRAAAYNDFHEQPLLPYKLSSFGPGMASGDISGNGLDDIFIGASPGNDAVILYQRDNGEFEQVPFELYELDREKKSNHTAVLLFDANGSGYPDIYLVSGGIDEEQFDLRDQFFINNGDGTFSNRSEVLPEFSLNGSVARAADFTGNGKPDLFVGSRNEPAKYPEAQQSLLLRNDTENGEVRFTDVTDQAAPMLHSIGMINDAAWTDFSGNGEPDLVLAGEWIPVTFLQNNGGNFEDVTNQQLPENENGWWTSINAADLTGNGLDDYVIGNFGLNSLYKASEAEPVSVYFGDISGNGFHESIVSMYLPDEDGEKKEYPAHSREDVTRHIPALSADFSTHEAFGKATIEEILPPALQEKAEVKQVTTMASKVILNWGEGLYEIKNLPAEAQFSPIFGIAADDVTGNGYVDLILNGNLFDADIQSGAYNALNGLVLEGIGKGNFSALSILKSGIYVPGDGRGLVKITDAHGNRYVAAFQRDGNLKIFQQVSD